MQQGLGWVSIQWAAVYHKDRAGQKERSGKQMVKQMIDRNRVD